MLQPAQLKHVTASYPEEVAELRGFLASAGIQTGTGNALTQVATRLANDFAFRRDLLSHIWVILHGHDQQISYAELLGMLALAAAGPVFAAAAQTNDAHDLLRFLIDARQSLQSQPLHSEKPSTSFARAPVSPLRPLPLRVGDNGDAPQSSTRRTEPAKQEARPSLRTAALLIASAAAVVISIGFMMWIHRQSQHGVARALPAVDRRLNHPEPDAGLQRHAAGVAKQTPHLPLRILSAVSQNEIPARASLTRPFAAPSTHNGVPTSWTPQQALPPVAEASPDNNARNLEISAIVPVREQSGHVAATPSTVLSQRLGSRTLPPDYLTDDNPYNAKYPRLLRRRPLLPLAAEDSEATEMVASNEPPELFRRDRDSPGSSIAATVRPVSLGIMAANILYSPAPAYPPAAAAAHVQGEVKVQAEVDRDGNVAFARVISGPALLRDAAVDAVQRWRYRPYVSAGRPVAMSATAVLDFQLQ